MSPPTSGASAPASTPLTAPAPLYGRDDTLAGIGELLTGVRAGHGGAIVVSGEPGIGKTALLQRAVQLHGRGMQVLETSGKAVERHLHGAALQLMLQPVTDAVDRLPSSSAGVLHRLTGQEPPRADSPALIANALRTLLADLAGNAPVVCVVDDWQWLDDLSASVLSVLSERLAEIRVALLVASRDADGGRLPAPVPQWRLGGVDDDAARRLLGELSPMNLDPAVRDRMVAEARGNPSLLSDEVDAAPSGLAWTSGFGYPAPPGPPAPAAAILRELGDLPAGPRLLLTVAAADPTGDPAAFRRAVTVLGLGDEDVAVLATRGLLTVGDRVCFAGSATRRHLYRAVSLLDRREAHRILAVAYDRPGDRDRRAWHRALAREAPLGTLASEIVAALGVARARGGHPAVAALLVHAARLSVHPGDRNRLLLRAADARRAAGDFAGAADLVDVVRHHASDKHVRLLAAAVSARVAFELRRDRDSAGALLAAATSAAEAGLPQAGMVLRDARAAVRSLGRAGATEIASTRFGGLGTSADEGFAACWGPWHADGSWPSGDVRDGWDVDRFIAYADERLRAARDAGDLSGMPDALAWRAVGHLMSGEFDALDRLAAAGERIAALLGTPPPVHLRLIAAAWRGNELQVRRLTAAVRADARARGDERLLAVAAYAKAVFLNGAGRYAEAVAAGGPELPADDGLALWLPLELIEAGVRAGRSDLAEAAAGRLPGTGHLAGTAAGRGSYALGHALISTSAEADERYRKAIAELTGSGCAGQLARAHLLYGEWLRREGRKGEARDHLRTAETSLTRLGATAFAARARRESSATGRRTRARRPETAGGLTAQEAIVANLVASGATNREIAGTLFLSLRTVEAHVRAIFAKLGITSRRQLAGRTIPDGPKQN
ncbi:AAA family ATPase [Actinoplanes missouriensis]|uniref:AAA family ATPase n=1 Tax=Actinoplanes missouriensis TaxID=1866 RepID=UPI0033FE5075